MKTINVVAAIILNEENKVFIGKRSYGSLKDKWEFPGGKIEEGEDDKTALTREIKEELNLNIEVNSLFYTLDYDYPTFHVHMNCYFCKIIDGNLKLSAHSECKYIDANSFFEYEFLESNENLLKNLQKFLLNKSLK